MPPEVIDLISSSPGTDENEKRPATKPTIRATRPLATSEPPPAIQLVDLADFDTTTEVDEPALPPSKPTTQATNRGEPKKAKSRIVLGSDPFASSDDGANRDNPISPAEVNGNKRRRVSPRDKLVVPKGRFTQRGKALENDPIFMSSPQLATTKSPDPFASSPKLCSDPYQSSPLLRPARSKDEKNTKALERRLQKWNDPIFSSSVPDEPMQKGGNHQVIDLIDSESNSDPEDILPDITNMNGRGRKRQSLRRVESDVLPTSQTERPIPKPKKSAPERAKDKEDKAAAKEAEKERRQQEREAKLKEKAKNAAMAEVNKIRTDKKVSTPEMIVDLPHSLNSIIKTQVETLLEPLDVYYTTWHSPVENVIKWRRKVKSVFNKDLGCWEPIPQRVDDEDHILIINAADHFVRLARENALYDHIAIIRRHFPKHNIIYLLEGMAAWMKKNRNIRNRQFTSGVRSNEGISTSCTTASRRRKAPAQEYVEEDIVEDAMLQLQIVHNLLVHHTAVPLETAQWITIFTQHISTIPYKRQRDQATLGATFCMESGQVRTGDDARDSYTRLLQEIARVTAPIAYGVAAEYGSVSKLVNGLERGGPLLLEGVHKSANKDGVVSDRTIGPAMSRRLHKVFTGRDETSTDV